MGGDTVATGDPELRPRLLAAKLAGLVGDHLRATDPDASDVESLAFPGGAAALVDGEAWVLVDGAADRSLGAALGWALRRDEEIVRLHLVVDAEADAALLARVAAGFRTPVRVWTADGRRLVAASPRPATTAAPPPPEHLALISLIEEAGADPNVEHGVVTGEVRGLEVCRVVDHPTVGRLVDATDDGLDRLAAPGGPGRPADGVLLEVGVGANDREAFHLLHGDVPTAEALAGVVDAVRRHRSDDAPGHPLNRMAPERYLRWRAVEDPAGVGFEAIRPTPPPRPRPSMKLAAPCVAVGVRGDGGGTATLVFSSGVDLDVVPYALDAREHVRLLHDVDDEVTIVLPERDLLPVTRDIARDARTPVRFVTR